MGLVMVVVSLVGYLTGPSYYLLLDLHYLHKCYQHLGCILLSTLLRKTFTTRIATSSTSWHRPPAPSPHLPPPLQHLARYQPTPDTHPQHGISPFPSSSRPGRQECRRTLRPPNAKLAQLLLALPAFGSAARPQDDR